MVLEQLQRWLRDRYGCEEEDVHMAATFDELNLSPDEVAELAFLAGERFDVSVPDEALDSFETVEDLVGYVEDHL